MTPATFRVDDLVEVACSCGKADCFSPASRPKRGRVYDASHRGRVFVDFWDTCGPNPDDVDDSRTYEFRTSDLWPIRTS